MKEYLITSVKSLPPLPKTISEVNRVYNDSSCGISDMVDVIEKDPMVVANILKAANSPLYGFAKEIDSIFQAVSLFGPSTTRAIITANAIRTLLNVDMEPYGISSERFTEISTIQALFASKWFKKINPSITSKLYILALLQEVGKILIASDIIQEEQVEQFKSEIKVTNTIAQVEKSFVDTTSSIVSAMVFKHWQFDDEFINTIKFADYPSKTPSEYQKLSYALNIIKTIIPVNKPLSEQSILFGIQKAQKLGFDTEIITTTVEELKEEITIL